MNIPTNSQGQDLIARFCKKNSLIGEKIQKYANQKINCKEKIKFRSEINLQIELDHTQFAN